MTRKHCAFNVCTLLDLLRNGNCAWWQRRHLPTGAREEITMANETYTGQKVEPGARYHEGERPTMGKLLLPMLLSAVLGFGLGWAMKPDREVETNSTSTPYTEPAPVSPGSSSFPSDTTTPGGSLSSPGGSGGTSSPGGSPPASTTPGGVTTP